MTTHKRKYPEIPYQPSCNLVKLNPDVSITKLHTDYQNLMTEHTQLKNDYIQFKYYACDYINTIEHNLNKKIEEMNKEIDRLKAIIDPSLQDVKGEKKEGFYSYIS